MQEEKEAREEDIEESPVDNKSLTCIAETKY